MYIVIKIASIPFFLAILIETDYNISISYQSDTELLEPDSNITNSCTIF